ncbi:MULTISPECIES: hypothetical protein [Ehrlichia]|uniref:Uncharacterized protein n=1 Tax=Ehrlichia cf. muris str. EmCRT TaxID=1359167 RepID=A0A0F3NCI6_9RICK|nr:MULTISPECIES: hypothetical protein [Ehrlichia]KJV65740.1 hypothetical protein EMUCRT_0696 [Ehrlichia cf. muris str. EmCRT]
MTSTKNTDTTQKTRTTRRKTTTTNKNKLESFDTNNITQATASDKQTQNSDTTLDNMGFINLKKVESDDAEIIYKSNTSKQSSFLKDLWHSLKEYFSSTQ